MTAHAQNRMGLPQYHLLMHIVQLQVDSTMEPKVLLKVASRRSIHDWALGKTPVTSYSGVNEGEHQDGALNLIEGDIHASVP